MKTILNRVEPFKSFVYQQARFLENGDGLEIEVKYNLQSVRSYLLREDFQRFWEYTSATWAGTFLDPWCVRAMRSKIDPLKKVAGMLRRHRALLLNWFRAHGTISAGIVEGFNNKAKLTSRKSYGFRSTEVLQIALYHNLASLPEPKFTHEFC